MVAREYLDSDRVNFLIWRYLLEGNYRETAAKFQKEWHVKEPHRDLPFACHVKGHALVSVINRGLIYYALERDCVRKQLSQDAATEPEALQAGVFGPLDAQPPAKDDEMENGAPSTEEVDASRKRTQHQTNGSPTSKRPRLSNGYDNVLDASMATTPMEVDSEAAGQNQGHQTNHSDNHAYPSPLEGEQGSPPVPRTDGPEQGTQVDKVEELTPSTTFIRLGHDARSADGQTPAQSPSSAMGADNAPILLQCEWNPRDPSSLAAAGTDALARVWTVSRSTTVEPDQDHVSPPVLSLLDNSTPRATTVTALAWDSEGQFIAIAKDEGTRATISVWSVDGSHITDLHVPEAPVMKLLWNPSNSALLYVAPDNGSAIAKVYSASTVDTLSYHLPGFDIGGQPLDAVWTSDTEFLFCGGDVLVSLRCGESSISEGRKFETKEDDSFTQVAFDRHTKLAATASATGTLDLWDEAGQRKSISAHQGAITTMMWQPLLPSQRTRDDERIIATGGEDCAILLWNARQPESKATCFLTMDSPIVKLAFTPDGSFIAGATSSQVLIWKVGNTAVPRASWSRPPHSGWLSPKEGLDSEVEDEHCLCWDATGQKLAYGTNNRLAVINFAG